jgi:hypothetical protein
MTTGLRKGMRQGDVLLVPVAKVRGQRIGPTNRGYTLAEGERTGHHHSIPASPTAAAFLSRDGLFVQGAGDPLRHQEHDPHPVEGDYEVIQQRRAVEHRVLPSID